MRRFLRNFVLLSVLANVSLLVVLGDDTESSTDATREAEAFDAKGALDAVNAESEAPPFARLWTSKSRHQLFVSLSISSNGERVLLCDNDGNCHVYQGDDGARIATLPAPDSMIVITALSNDGKIAAAGCSDGSAIVFDTNNGQVLQNFKSTTRPALGMRISNDNRYVTWFDMEFHLRRGDIRSGTVAKGDDQRPQSAADPHIFAIAADGCSIVFGSIFKETCLLYQFADGADSPAQKQTRPSIRGCTSVAFEKNTLVYYNANGELVAQREVANVPPGSTYPYQSCLCYLTPDELGPPRLALPNHGKWCLGVGRDQVEIHAGDLLGYPSIHRADLSNAGQVAIAPDGLRIAIVDGDAHLSVLALPEVYERPLWTFFRTVRQLVQAERYDAVEEIGELLQDDPTPFYGMEFSPKYCTFNAIIKPLVKRREPDPASDSPLDKWLAAKPESNLARVLKVDELVQEAWAGRGDGFASSVTQEGWEIFHRKVTQAHAVVKPLLKEKHPPPQVFCTLFDISKAESWSEEKCMEYVDQVMELSPRYVMPHLCMVEKLLMRWGGRPHSSAEYAATVADRVGGDDGDALYAELALRIAFYEPPELVKHSLGIDFERAFRGATALQKISDRHEYGVLAEFRLAGIADNKERLREVAAIIEKEHTHFCAGVFYQRQSLNELYKKHLHSLSAPPHASHD